MNRSEIFRKAYALFQEIDNAPSDADIIMLLNDALDAAYYLGYGAGIVQEAEWAQQEAAERHAEFAEAVAEQEAKQDFLAEVDRLAGRPRRATLDTFFSDDVDHGTVAT
jgi:hypothetical protein